MWGVAVPLKEIGEEDVGQVAPLSVCGGTSYCVRVATSGVQIELVRAPLGGVAGPT